MSIFSGPEFESLRKLVWGAGIKEDIFQRWTQGMVFSDFEPSALVQFEGGPCAILAPVQAFLLKNLLQKKITEDWRKLDLMVCNELLVLSLTQMLKQANSEGPFYIFSMDETTEDLQSSPSAMNSERKSEETVTDLALKTIKLDQVYFHSNLRYTTFSNSEDMLQHVSSRIILWQQSNSCGLLLFLYSLLMTKGLDCVRREMTDPEEEPLINGTHGHGSQSLINLMVTGHSTSHVWDGEHDLGGLKLYGIRHPSDIGFLTLLEHLRYCQVGSYLKNPRYPIWVLASETHLTVLFSKSQQLVNEETESERATRIFKSFDPEGNGFIPTALLGDLLRSLNLVSEPEYIKIMEGRLDEEGVGIVLLYSFMEEFFPPEKKTTPDVFKLWHWNGLSYSNADSKVEYRLGEAVLLETEVRCLSDSNPILTCLQTKWPSIDVRWVGSTPSIN